ncbi:hypothetical protein DTO96_100089 [Ephemeroptericola cinctiostellae]|uniref:ComE operon protein 1 n=1 Tax=Ephemeroptericola cinctiostellae TaxID=2268024 RepID=A0A345D7P8_9BURK|nr:helix-hairpin-helix domain-containing protein [Ephemeroptericola cinctiostellae]AXF84386.1 hypothetical protein DTO96_100089 [Ephemeroptericola cinctiostellae]
MFNFNPIRAVLQHSTRIVCVALGLVASGSIHAADVNVASHFQLEATRGIGPKLAESIIVERTNNGAFKNWDDFAVRVKGVGEKKLKIMQADGLTLGTK